MKTLGRFAFVIGAALVASAPTLASAVSTPRSTQGSDYSTNSSTGLRVYACDEEDDGHDVSADFYRIGTGSMSYVQDTYGNGCSSTGLSTVVYKHRIVELVPWSTDYYGDWVYPS